MIIVKVPTRTSFIGGGSEILNNIYRKYGLVLGCSIQQYVYVMMRYLPPYNPHTSRISYSEVETVNSNSQIKHKVVRKALEFFRVESGIECNYISDIPSFSGLGTSSSFVVGLIHTLAELTKIPYTKKDILNWSINLEQNYLEENIGMQDASWATMAGLAYIKFNSLEDVEYHPFMFSQKEIEQLESHLMLFHTKIPRVSSSIAGKYYPSLVDKSSEMDKLIDFTHLGIQSMRRRDFMAVGEIMGKTWEIKRSLHLDISSPLIDSYIEIIKNNGGFAKLCGAGSGGSILAFVEPNNQNKIRSELKDLVEIPVKIAFEGSKIIHKE